MDKVCIVGAGLAGSEAAWQVAQAGIAVDLYEMRPQTMTPAHKSDLFAELVCSNSFRAGNIENAVGLLKEEMRRMNSLIMRAADVNSLPAGGALAVDRTGFSEAVTKELSNNPLITIHRNEVIDIPRTVPTIIATGPLTSEKLVQAIADLSGEKHLYFYDAAAPIVSADSLDYDKIYRASRYGKGDGDYLNCPMTKSEYEHFYNELINAETTGLRDFEKPVFFEGCMPVEAMASRGIDTLRFGPLKPVGLPHPQTGEIPYAVVQLRQDNFSGSLYNLVGFQTHLKWAEQKRVFGLIPGLEKAEFVRYGVIHRNTYINSPHLLDETLQFKRRCGLFFAGQMTGVEGYVESAASGLVAGINAARMVKGKNMLVFPPETAHGALCRYITFAASENFQPMNINFGLLPSLGKKVKDKKQKNALIAERALEALKFIAES